MTTGRGSQRYDDAIWGNDNAISTFFNYYCAQKHCNVKKQSRDYVASICHLPTGDVDYRTDNRDYKTSNRDYETVNRDYGTGNKLQDG